MKKLLKDKSRIYRQPPAELETRILLASRIAARMNRGAAASSRRANWFIAAGAAAMLAVGSILLIPSAPRRAGETTVSAPVSADPLAAAGDWSRFDQESYNLSCQLNSERAELSELTSDFYII